jgi:hypothetical protein
MNYEKIQFEHDNHIFQYILTDNHRKSMKKKNAKVRVERT